MGILNGLLYVFVSLVIFLIIWKIFKRLVVAGLLFVVLLALLWFLGLLA